MKPEDFEFYKKFLHDKSGLSLSQEKVYLIESRLTPVARRWKLSSLEDLTAKLRLNPDRKLVDEVVDAMTTNETLFFRDDRPFAYFKKNVLPNLIKAREARKTLKIWSAACSTGQEAYSISMSLMDAIPNVGSWKIDILGTDISDKALAQATKAEYSQFEIQRGLPILLLTKYFQQSGTSWKLCDQIRNMVRFEHFNLLDPMESLGQFDIIFCRNVLIYFDDATKKKVLTSLSKRLAPDGFLFLGGSETAMGLCDSLKNHPDCSGLFTLELQQAKLSSLQKPQLAANVAAIRKDQR